MSFERYPQALLAKIAALTSQTWLLLAPPESERIRRGAMTLTAGPEIIARFNRLRGGKFMKLDQATLLNIKGETYNFDRHAPATFCELMAAVVRDVLQEGALYGSALSAQQSGELETLATSWKSMAQECALPENQRVLVNRSEAGVNEPSPEDKLDIAARMAMEKQRKKEKEDTKEKNKLDRYKGGKPKDRDSRGREFDQR